MTTNKLTNSNNDQNTVGMLLEIEWKRQCEKQKQRILHFMFELGIKCTNILSIKTVQTQKKVNSKQASLLFWVLIMANSKTLLNKCRLLQALNQAKIYLF